MPVKDGVASASVAGRPFSVMKVSPRSTWKSGAAATALRSVVV
jgi:hypothetical protein